MPWNEVKPMEQKILFIADFLRGGRSFSELCRLYGISRKTGYKWVERYRMRGTEGLDDRSRKTMHCPHQTPYAVRKSIVELRQRGGLVFGPKKIEALLSRQHPQWPVPSRTTIYNILRREGLVHPRKTKPRVPRHARPLSRVQEPNEVWTADYKGQFPAASGWCYPLTVLDHKSRFLLGCRALSSTKSQDAQGEFERLFRTYGLPERIRTDNGVPFASRSSGGLSRLSIWWVRLGIVPERIEPGKPQQNGRHERMHKTLKEATASPPARTLAEQQDRFDAFTGQYNCQRPHEGLGQDTPSAHYRPSPRAMPEKLPELEYPGYMALRRVSGPGLITLRKKIIYVGHLLHGETVALEEIDDGLWDVYFGPVRLGSFNEHDSKTVNDGYISLNCYP